MLYERKQARKAERLRKQKVLAKRKRVAKAAPALLAALEMVSNSIFQDEDGEWQLSRPAELLQIIADEAIAQAKDEK